MSPDELDLCGRCLVILSVTSIVRDETAQEDCPEPTNLRSLRPWVEERIFGFGNHRISVDGRPDAFRPVTTWHGDPVCWDHLIECRQREMGRRP
jgi:hypothetical protein